MSKVKKYFFAGFFIILPAFVTVYVLYAIFIFIDGIWGKLLNFYLRKYLGFAIPGLGFILGMLTILVVGFIATNLFGKRLFKFFEQIFLKFPFIKLIYDPAKQIVDSFISRDNPAFKKVVMVEYPSKGIWSVGFLTNEGFKEAQEKTGEDLLHIFIATTPSPLTGFLILVPKRDVKILDIPVESGVKLVVSGGIVKP
jgi:uncharacterized membrane protein